MPILWNFTTALAVLGFISDLGGAQTFLADQLGADWLSKMNEPIPRVLFGLLFLLIVSVDMYRRGHRNGMADAAKVAVGHPLTITASSLPSTGNQTTGRIEITICGTAQPLNMANSVVQTTTVRPLS
jgi:hypothetical protein